uniref:C2H2-type domain-containing protein n=1 Tax=Rhodnius prolixus TaxID=13249 RepID=T1HG44_RHOPR
MSKNCLVQHLWSAGICDIWDLFYSPVHLTTLPLLMDYGSEGGKKLNPWSLPIFIDHLVTNINKEKPHKCSLCSKSFPTPGDLKSHMYVHNGSWPYRCNICSRGFSKHTNLKNHLFLHTGINNLDLFYGNIFTNFIGSLCFKAGLYLKLYPSKIFPSVHRVSFFERKSTSWAKVRP